VSQPLRVAGNFEAHLSLACLAKEAERFGAGQVGPKTKVDSPSERQVFVRIAIDAEFVGRLEDFGISVGGGETEYDFVTLCDLLTTDHHIFECCAAHTRERGDVSKHFFNHRTKQRLVGENAIP